MSKVDKLAKEYKIPPSFVKVYLEHDKTPTKKYAEFVFKSKNHWGSAINLQEFTRLCALTQDYEKLLPHIPKDYKDINSKHFSNFYASKLSDFLQPYREVLKEKSFDKKNEIYVIEETDDHIFLVPKTFMASKKYGMGTKWCTTSSDIHFQKYSSGQYLAYLLKKEANNNLSKIGFCMAMASSPFDYGMSIHFYDAKDESRTSSDYYKEWGADNFKRLVDLYRNYCFERSMNRLVI